MSESCSCSIGSTPIAQPIRTSAGGVPEFNGSSIALFTDGNYSIKVLNSKGDQVYYSGSVENNDNVLNFATLQDAVENTSAKVGDAANLAERTTGNGGGAMWDYVLASGVTVNPFTIVACTGVSTLALKLRVTSTNMPALNLGSVPNTDFNIVPLISYLYSNSEGIKALHFDEGEYTFDENWPYMVSNRAIYGVKNLTKFKYIGTDGTVGNLIDGIKLRALSDAAVVAAAFSGITVDMNGAEYVRGVTSKYYTRQSYIGDINVQDCGIGSEMLSIDKSFYTNFGPISLRNSNSLRLGSGLVLTTSEASTGSTNSIEIPDLVIIGCVDGITFDTAIGQMNTIRVRGSVEYCTNAVTYTDGLGINEAILDLHMENNTRNVNWIGSSAGGKGNIHWKGAWSGVLGGSIHCGSSDHFFENRFTNTLEVFKFNTARISMIGVSPDDKGGTSGVEGGLPVDYLNIDMLQATAGSRQSSQKYVSTSQGLWLKGATGNTTTITTGYVDFDFSADLRLVSNESVVKITVSYFRPDGSFKIYEAMGLKRNNSPEFQLRQLSGDALDANFDVLLTSAGIGSVKSTISESITYSMMIIPL